MARSRLAIPMPIQPASTDFILGASLIGFAAGGTISALLLVLTLRAVRLPGTPRANLLLAACSLVWNLGGFAQAAAITLGEPGEARLVRILLAVQFTAAALWPVPVLAIWSSLASNRRRVGCRILQFIAVVGGAALTVLLWAGTLGGMSSQGLIQLKESTAYNGTFLVILGMALLRDRLSSRGIRLPSWSILVGVCTASAAIVLQYLLPWNLALCNVLRVVSEQSTLLIVLGAFFLFSRFRYADIFIRHSLRIVSAAVAAGVFLLLNHAFLRFDLSRASHPEVVRSFVETLAVAIILLLYALLDRHIGVYVDRWIFRAPDYRSLLRQLTVSLSDIHQEQEIATRIEVTAKTALDLQEAQVIALEGLPASSLPEAVMDGELYEVDPCHGARLALPIAGLELLVPIRSAGRVSHVLAVAPGSARHGLVIHEIDFMRTLAAQFGHRLDSLRQEEQRIERQSRESVLRQQVTEAELRALRAQIDPHFLFNSLNSIANLVVENPERAEMMTLRLARVFRHVLANSSRPLVTLGEEIEFLRTYLQIEEARFGDRLIVSIDVDPAVAAEQIPSLILQPIVENALKHGLGPKPGPGHLWIAAQAKGKQMQLCVEDDGVGMRVPILQSANGAPATSTVNGNRRYEKNGKLRGVGLENVAQRLTTLYQDQGRLALEPRPEGGTRVTVLIPREQESPAS